MAETEDQYRTNHSAMDSGLKVTDLGYQGLVFETTSTHHQAVMRHRRVVDTVISDVNAPPGALLLILLVHQEMVLTLAGIQAAVSIKASLYGDTEVKYLEWPVDGGWIDRRQLTRLTVLAIHKNGGIRVRNSDWRWLVSTLSGLHPERQNSQAIFGFVADAQAYWVGHSTGPLFGHAIRMRPFQMLPRAALARRHSMRPQLSPSTGAWKTPAALVFAQTVRTYSNATATLQDMVTFTGQVARRKGSKDSGRSLLIERIDMILPIAAQEGRVQVIVLGAIQHAIKFGGIRGDLLAPITIYEYLRQGVVKLLETLLNTNLDQKNGWEWLELYRENLSHVRDSQRSKFASFLEVFHRFLIIAGFDPLPSGIPGGHTQMPPEAAVVWPHELELAIEYISAYAETDRIRLQATLGLVCGYWIPMRTYELWCLRVGDVNLTGAIYLTIYPRRRDGVGKVESLKQEHQVHDAQLKTLLLDMNRLRRIADYADDGDQLLGEPGKPGCCHEESATNELMNAALRWATGDSKASYYDLRHTVFSRRAEPVLIGKDTATDVADYYKVSAGGGHAGPSSTSAYVHWVERAINAQITSSHFPEAVATTNEAHPNVDNIFEDVGSGALAGERTPLVKPDEREHDERPCEVMGLTTRADILWRVSQNYSLAAVAGGCSVAEEVVKQVVADMVETMVQAKMVSYAVRGSLRKQCLTISAWALWARAAKQPKNIPVTAMLESCISNGNFSRLQLLWQDWLLCRNDEYLDMTNPRPAIRIVNFLFDCGIPRRSLVVTSALDAPPLPPEWKDLSIESRPVGNRGGRSPHRLFMAELGASGSDATGATISMVGFHWLMLLVGSILVAKEAI